MPARPPQTPKKSAEPETPSPAGKANLAGVRLQDSDSVSVIAAATNAVTTITDPSFNRPIAFGVFIQPPEPPPQFAGTPGFSNCHGQSVAALAQQLGGLGAAAAALGFPDVPALQHAIKTFCHG
jgi:hypothetical protein